MERVLRSGTTSPKSVGKYHRQPQCWSSHETAKKCDSSLAPATNRLDPRRCTTIASAWTSGSLPAVTASRRPIAGSLAMAALPRKMAAVPLGAASATVSVAPDIIFTYLTRSAAAAFPGPGIGTDHENGAGRAVTDDRKRSGICCGPRQHSGREQGEQTTEEEATRQHRACLTMIASLAYPARPAAARCARI